MDVAKTKAIRNWLTPSHVKQVQSFIGFANFYQHFIVNFSETVTPLTCLTRIDTQFSWGSEHQDAFYKLKLAFTRVPVLAHFDPVNLTVVDTDASDYAIVAIISLISPEDGDLHPIAFFSRGMKPAEINYEIYNKELLVIFEAFQQWQNYLEGSTHAVLVLLDHKNLEYFATTKQLTHRQVRWSEYLSGFNYLIWYHAGRLGTKPDALTCCEDVYPWGDNVYALANPHNFQSMFKPSQLLRAVVLDSAALLVSIKHGLATDPIAQEHLKHLHRSQPHLALDSDPWSLAKDGELLLFKGALYVPDHADICLDILHSCHDHRLAGHPCIGKTVSNIRHQFYWPQLVRFVTDYVRSCSTCC